MRAAPIMLLAAFALLACAPQIETDRLTLTPVSFTDLPGWQDDDLSAALPALLRSCDRLLKLPDDRRLGPRGMAGRAADWRPPCAALGGPGGPGNGDAARRYLQSWFRPYLAANHDRADGLFTGYYEPILQGARTRGDGYEVPLHGRPSDLVNVDLGAFREDLAGERIAGRVVEGRLRPYATRGEIQSRGLGGQAPVLAWVADPVDAFFLHIQGSGRVRLRDGSEVRLGYAGQNGHPYKSIGRELVARGEMTVEEASMQSIKAWVAAHPAAGRPLLGHNPSYVFFRQLDGDGPLGAEGVVLTPGRSLAVDRRFLALGLPVWLDVEHPLPDKPRLRRLMVAQDTGGAIRGPVRGDFYWGSGPEAGLLAGSMKSRGRYFLLLPRGVTVDDGTVVAVR